MDLKNQTKPIHLRCPKCGYDFSYNSRHIEFEYDRLREKVKSLKAELTQMNADRVPKNSPKRKVTIAKYDQAVLELESVKRTRKAVSESIQSNKEKIFRMKVKAILGEEKHIKLRQECEDEMTYNLYDMAIQNHTNFENA